VIICVIGIILLAIIIGAIFIILSVSKKASRSLDKGPAQRIPCPYCAEMILPDAKVCRFCGREL